MKDSFLPDPAEVIVSAELWTLSGELFPYAPPERISVIISSVSVGAGVYDPKPSSSLGTPKYSSHILRRQSKNPRALTERSDEIIYSASVEFAWRVAKTAKSETCLRPNPHYTKCLKL